MKSEERREERREQREERREKREQRREKREEQREGEHHSPTPWDQRQVVRACSDENRRHFEVQVSVPAAHVNYFAWAVTNRLAISGAIRSIFDDFVDIAIF